MKIKETENEDEHPEESVEHEEEKDDAHAENEEDEEIIEVDLSTEEEPVQKKKPLFENVKRHISHRRTHKYAATVGAVLIALALIGNRYFGKNYNSDRIAALGIYHDVPEVYTGDLPTPIKYFNTSSKESYRQIERKAIDALLSRLPQELREDYRQIFYYEELDPEAKRIIKAADKICAYIKCLDEERCGNREFTSAKATLLKSIEELDSREADFFMDNFLSSFNMTLDELQG